MRFFSLFFLIYLSYSCAIVDKAKEITDKELKRQFSVLENDWKKIQTGFNHAISPEDQKRVNEFFKDYSIEDAAWDTTKYLIKAREIDFIKDNIDLIKLMIQNDKEDE